TRFVPAPRSRTGTPRGGGPAPEEARAPGRHPAPTPPLPRTAAPSFLVPAPVTVDAHALPPCEVTMHRDVHRIIVPTLFGYATLIRTSDTTHPFGGTTRRIDTVLPPDLTT